MEKKRVLLLQGSLMHYRIPCWNILAEEYDFTIGYYDKDQTVDGNCLFKKVKFGTAHIGPFIIVKGARKYAKKFDVVIIMDDLHVLTYSLLPFMPHKYRVLTWGIGFRVSYTRPFDTLRKHQLLDKAEELILRKSDANIIYMEKAKDFWKASKIDMNKVFCAPNTTEVYPIEFKPEAKKNFLFVGTLYKGKGIDLLIKAFANVKEMINSDAKLDIVGGGTIKDELIAIVDTMGLAADVNFVGPIFDEKVLAQYFQNALLCISPTQGGLSCPKSMGYGVPFVTRKDAITGGEIYHMTPGVNGIIYENDEELTTILLDALQNKEKYLMMGKAAKDYYDHNATPQHMAQGAISAIDSITKDYTK